MALGAVLDAVQLAAGQQVVGRHGDGVGDGVGGRGTPAGGRGVDGGGRRWRATGWLLGGR